MNRISRIALLFCSLFAILTIVPSAFAQRTNPGTTTPQGGGISVNPGTLKLAPCDLTVKQIALDQNNVKTARVRVENNGPGQSKATTLLVKFTTCDCPQGASKQMSLTVPALKKGEGVWITVHSQCVIGVDAFWTATVDPNKQQDDSNWNNNSAISDTLLK
jgi:hypothetical protein